MKQHITLRQFNELSFRGKEKMLLYCVGKDLLYSKYNISLGGIRYNLLSIGQMIELLAKVRGDRVVAFIFSEWVESGVELCDMLWSEIVKEFNREADKLE
jgi:hypothetical protein